MPPPWKRTDTLVPSQTRSLPLQRSGADRGPGPGGPRGDAVGGTQAGGLEERGGRHRPAKDRDQGPAAQPATPRSSSELGRCSLRPAGQRAGPGCSGRQGTAGRGQSGSGSADGAWAFLLLIPEAPSPSKLQQPVDVATLSPASHGCRACPVSTPPSGTRPSSREEQGRCPGDTPDPGTPPSCPGPPALLQLGGVSRPAPTLGPGPGHTQQHPAHRASKLDSQ